MPANLNQRNNMLDENQKNSRGVRTSEWWLTLATAAIGLAIMAGWISPEGVSTVDKITGMAVAGLAALGYQVSRGMAKGGGAK